MIYPRPLKTNDQSVIDLIDLTWELLCNTWESPLSFIIIIIVVVYTHSVKTLENSLLAQSYEPQNQATAEPRYSTHNSESADQCYVKMRGKVGSTTSNGVITLDTVMDEESSNPFAQVSDVWSMITINQKWNNSKTINIMHFTHNNAYSTTIMNSCSIIIVTVKSITFFLSCICR